MALVAGSTLEEKQPLGTETKFALLTRSACVTSPGAWTILLKSWVLILLNQMSAAL